MRRTLRRRPSASMVVAITALSGSTSVVGGGASVADESNGWVNDSDPSGKTGWTADIGNDNSSAMPATVYAICAPAAATG